MTRKSYCPELGHLDFVTEEWMRREGGMSASGKFSEATAPTHGRHCSCSACARTRYRVKYQPWECA